MASCCSRRCNVDGDGAVVLGCQTRGSMEEEGRGTWFVSVDIYSLFIALMLMFTVFMIKV